MRGPHYNNHRPTRERLLQLTALDPDRKNIVNNITMTNDNDTDSLKPISSKSEYSSQDDNIDTNTMASFSSREFDVEPMVGAIHLDEMSDIDEDGFLSSDDLDSCYAWLLSTFEATPGYKKYKQLTWQIDSGANVHICNDRKAFNILQPGNSGVHLADGHPSKSKGSGIIF